ncbi:hypothetical protein B0T18DRAFT_400992 [Schizothecium vesticola]|uniref:Uncharacterized protein n=1 Tax=Schizothecium vesticola TaxID=314040 RepID=A0AA40K9G7_9PEZI|nr:hypothetical protein B0T18DRAFT_400992 [Schizothecium vesticola]
MSWKHEYPFEKMLEERVQTAMETRPLEDRPGPFRQGWLEETYKAKIAERGIVLDESGDPLESTGEEDAPPATAEPVPENRRAPSPSPPVRQKQSRGRATKSAPRGDVGSTALKPFRPGRVSKLRKPAQPGGSKQVGGSGAPTVENPVTPRRRSQRLQLASEERPAVEAREDPDRPGPVRRGTKLTVGAGAKSGKKPLGTPREVRASLKGREDSVP